jgi:hypothetical protein
MPKLIVFQSRLELLMNRYIYLLFGDSYTT